MSLRFVQAFGASMGTSIGSAVISDIYKLEERGTVMGVFWAVCQVYFLRFRFFNTCLNVHICHQTILLGLTLAPLAGGIAAQYSSWRVLQLAFGFYGLLVWALIALFLPETSHPETRGKDVENKKRESLGLPPKHGLVWVNPAKSLLLLQSPNLSAVVSVLQGQEKTIT
jgi:MFS family permease